MFDRGGGGLASGSYEIVDALRVLCRLPDGRKGNLEPHRIAAVETAEALAFSASIDEYIERHRDDKYTEDCAKLAIAKAILEAENSSDIFVSHRRPAANGFNTTGGSWLASYLRDVSRGFSARDLPEAFQNVTVVNFNYDRCFEHYAYHWLQSVYRIEAIEAAEIVSGFQVYHPYGKLGPLEWQDPHGIPYGAGVDTRRLLTISKRIRTYSEAKEPETGIEVVKERLGAARNVVFLGFGFHQQNLNLLRVDESRQSAAWCFATTKGISKPSWEVYKSRIRETLSVAPHRDLYAADIDGNCEDFWAEYSTVLTA
ncbi:hypothetical protein [Aurantiacibacter gilvus]|uniref:SIR2-like domain-containing protein n=1 Tax=Aurantiacibacter gilvus TaxID=3139141 RepID=A0ABU9II18_9SPHN